MQDTEGLENGLEHWPPCLGGLRRYVSPSFSQWPIASVLVTWDVKDRDPKLIGLELVNSFKYLMEWFEGKSKALVTLLRAHSKKQVSWRVGMRPQV